MQKLIGRVRAAIDRYEMLEDGDRVALGISGGKDSLFLLEAMASLQKYYPKRFSLLAVTLDPLFNGKEADYSKIKKRCGELGIKYLIKRTDLYKIVFDDRKEASPCSLCAKMRRGILHNTCIENRCNKIALGHHYDDAVQTLLMNLFYSGRIGCFSPKTFLSRKNITMIRPLIFCEEREVARAVRRAEIEIVKSECPVDGCTSRKNTGDLIKNLEKTFPDIKAKLLGAMQRSGVDGW